MSLKDKLAKTKVKFYLGYELATMFRVVLESFIFSKLLSDYIERTWSKYVDPMLIAIPMGIIIPLLLILYGHISLKTGFYDKERYLKYGGKCENEPERKSNE